MNPSRSRRRRGGSTARTSVGANIVMLVVSLAAIAAVAFGIVWAIAEATLAFIDWIPK